jgi:uncharacterized protein YndB with AHSA1/START domain
MTHTVENKNQKTSDLPEILITRVLPVARDVVFKAWTDAKTLQKWWGPEGFTNPVCEADARAGGKIRIDMRGPDGTVYPMLGEYKEVAPERIVFTSGPVDAQGKFVLEALNTVTLSDKGGKTEITVEAHIVRATPEADPYLRGMPEGWKQTVDRLETFVTKS